MATFPEFILPVLRGGLAWMSRRSLPQTDGKLTLPGLESRVEIIRDRWGIPHIYAENHADLSFAQGFVHAQDRLWQMELNRRTARGLLSEVFGELALDTDRTVRTFGFNRLGQADLEALNGPERDLLEAYTAGVNAFLGQVSGKLPVEFSLVRHRPLPWEPLDTAAFMRVVIWQLSHAWYGEIIRAQIAEAVGLERTAELEIHYPPANPIILPAGIEFNRLDPDGRLLPGAQLALRRGLGSNAWAVCGEKSASGHPYLCNDMHLMLSLPSIWYEIHLEAGDFQVSGVSIPGVPGVLVGHNAHIAWGCTLAYTDCEDLFVERFDPENPQRYQYKGEWLEAEVIPEAIPVKGRPEPHVEQVLVTRHGPVISDVVAYAQERIAINSMALRPCPAYPGFLALDRARNWDEFVAAMRLIEAPQLNFAYADVDGNIGYWVSGRVPIRARGDGSIPALGWSGEYEWIAEIPFDEMPHALNPAQGYIVHCNNCMVPGDYPYFLGRVWMNGYRARRIVELLESKTKLSPQDFQALHVDFTCYPGQEFATLLEDFSSTDPDVQLVLERLRGWDGWLRTDSVAGAIYEVARYRLVRNLLEPGLGTELSLRLMGQGFHPVLFSSHEFYGHDTVTMLRLLGQPDSWWVQQAGGRERLIEKSLQEAVAWLRSALGPDPAGWQWGAIHRSIFAHALGIQKPLDKVFNRGPYPIGGDTDTPCQTAYHPDDPYDNKSWAPSHRQIIDLGDLTKSVISVPPGQSGQLGSPHYDDQIDPWLKGEYHPMLWTREQIEAAAEGRLELVPG